MLDFERIVFLLRLNAKNRKNKKENIFSDFVHQKVQMQEHKNIGKFTENVRLLV